MERAERTLIVAIGSSNSRKPHPHLDPKGKGERWMLLEPLECLKEENHHIGDAIPEQHNH